MNTSLFRSHDPELATLLRQAQEINPDIRFVSAEIVFGSYGGETLLFYAHSPAQAWMGSTPEVLLAGIFARVRRKRRPRNA